MNTACLRSRLCLPLCLLLVFAAGTVFRTNAQMVTGVQPASGSVDVPLNASIVITFSEAADDATLIQSSTGDLFIGSLNWSANIKQPILNMVASWSPDFKVLTLTYQEDLPGSSTITWEINPVGSIFSLKDGDTGAFPFANASGSFTTMEGNNCNPEGVPESFGRMFLSKSLQYVQTSALAPVLDSALPAVFAGIVKSPADNAVVAASLKLPNSTAQGLTPAGGQFFLSGEFDSQAEMDVAYPAGNYEMTMTRSAPPATVVNMGMTASYPGTPQVSNFPAAQAVNPALDFPLQWGAFSGASGSDAIVVSIQDGNTTVFEAPDLCVPIELPNTATSIVIPAGTLEAGKVYAATLSFYRSYYFSTNSPAGFLTSGALVKSTQFTINTSGSVVVPQPRLSTPGFAQGGVFTFTASNLTIGTGYQVEYSTTLLPDSWTFLEALTPAATSQPIVDSGSSDSTGQRFYRVIKP